MELLLKLMHTYLLLSFAHIALTNSDMPEYFCGKRLSNFLGSRCKLYNSPFIGKFRARRAIVEECCRKPCTQRYLLCNYCAKSDVICTSNMIQSEYSTAAPRIAMHPTESVQLFSREVTEKDLELQSKPDLQQKFRLCRQRLQNCRNHHRPF